MLLWISAECPPTAEGPSLPANCSCPPTAEGSTMSGLLQMSQGCSHCEMVADLWSAPSAA